jgi:hypothetical protein
MIKDILLGCVWFSLVLVFNDRVFLLFFEEKTIQFAWLFKSFFSAGISFLWVLYIKETIIPHFFRILLFLFVISFSHSFMFEKTIYYYDVSKVEIIFDVFLWSLVISIGALIGGGLGKVVVSRCASNPTKTQ